MARQIAVIPGILGSVLYHEQNGDPLELWSDNLFSNYMRLCKQPTSLNWIGTPAHSRLLKTIRISRVIPFGKSTVYQKLTERARSLLDVAGGD